MDSKLSHTLDSLLRIHFDKAATEAEKNTTLAMFRKKCERNNIDPDKYLANSSVNSCKKNNFSSKLNKTKYSNQTSKKTSSAYESQYTWNVNWNSKKEEIIFEIKEPIIEVKIHNGRRVLLISALCRKAQTSDRFGLQNFCIYSEGLNADLFKMNREYIFYSSGKFYFRDHCAVTKVVEFNGADSRIIF